MAQEIQVPVTVEFRTARVAWVRESARITSWWKLDGERTDRENLAAKLPNVSVGLFKFPLTELPEAERKECLQTFGNPSADADVQQICSAFRPEFLINSTKTYVESGELRKHSRPADAWQMRDEFSRLNPDSEEALEFLNRWGRWRPWRRYTTLSEMMQLQRVAKDALLASPTKWFASNWALPPLKPAPLPKYPYFSLLTDSCEHAIRLTVTVDLLRKQTFKTCARADCRVPFPVTSKHKREYCSQYCAHLESVRRNRKIPQRSA